MAHPRPPKKRDSTRVFRAAQLLATDPRAFASRLRSFASPTEDRRTPTNRRRLIKVNGITFEVDRTLDPRVRQMARGTYEPGVTGVLRSFLREGDTFVDVGANIGYISAFALGIVGTAGHVHAFEPVPRYFQRLLAVQRDNPAHRLMANRLALGEQAGEATIAVTNLANIGWNTMVPGFMNRDHIGSELQVTVTTFDEYAATNSVGQVRLVKIDAEGYEFPVLKGFRSFLRESSDPPVLVVEIAPGAYRRLRTSLDELAGFMTDLGYTAVDLRLSAPLDVTVINKTTNVVFLPRSLAGSLFDQR